MTETLVEALAKQHGCSVDWAEDSLRWRGKVLTGKHAHWCPDWDYLPIDETTSEWPCPCSVGARAKEKPDADK